MSLEAHKDKFDRLAELKLQIKELEEEAKGIADEVVSAMEAEGFDKVDHAEGTFTISGRKKWTFSEKTEALREQLKESEAGEKADGTATAEETKFVVFKVKK